jgi:hypothetical protein
MRIITEAKEDREKRNIKSPAQKPKQKIKAKAYSIDHNPVREIYRDACKSWSEILDDALTVLY